MALEPQQKVLLVVLIVIIIGVSVPLTKDAVIPIIQDLLLPYIQEKNAQAAYRKKFQPYLSKFIFNESNDESHKEAYVKGCRIIIEKRESGWQVSKMNFDGGRYPCNPQLAETVIWLEFYATQVGTYTDGDGAYRRDCKLKVVIQETGAKTDERIFKGTDPPDEKLETASGYGKEPYEEIIRYINRLPRK